MDIVYRKLRTEQTSRGLREWPRFILKLVCKSSVRIDKTAAVMALAPGNGNVSGKWD